jgi:hypothetical protein
MYIQLNNNFKLWTQSAEEIGILSIPINVVVVGTHKGITRTLKKRKRDFLTLTRFKDSSFLFESNDKKEEKEEGCVYGAAGVGSVQSGA